LWNDALAEQEPSYVLQGSSFPPKTFFFINSDGQGASAFLDIIFQNRNSIQMLIFSGMTHILLTLNDAIEVFIRQQEMLFLLFMRWLVFSQLWLLSFSLNVIF